MNGPTQSFNIGDLIVLEIAMIKFMDGMDLSMEAGRHCSTIIGKIENQIAAVTAQAQAMLPHILAGGKFDTDIIPGPNVT